MSLAPSSRRTAVVRLLLTLAGGALVWLVMGAVVPDGYTRPRHVVRASIVLVPTLLLWYALTRATGRVRRPVRGDLARVVTGALSYLLPTGVGVALVLGLGLATVTPQRPPGTVMAQGLLLLTLVLAFEAIPEELLFRDLVQTSLGRLVGPWLAVVGQAVLFAAWGVLIGASGSVDRAVLFVVFGLVQGSVRQLGGSVAYSIGFHAAFQLTAQWLIGGTWDAWAIQDAELWLTGALFLPAALLAPLVVTLVRRRRSRRPAAAPPVAAWEA